MDAENNLLLYPFGLVLISQKNDFLVQPRYCLGIQMFTFLFVCFISHSSRLYEYIITSFTRSHGCMLCSCDSDCNCGRYLTGTIFFSRPLELSNKRRRKKKLHQSYFRNNTSVAHAGTIEHLCERTEL